MAKATGTSRRAASPGAPKGERRGLCAVADADVAEAAAPDAEALPGPEEIAALMAPVQRFMEEARYGRIRSALAGLSRRPPQVVLLEGGNAEERLAAAHYWALRLNCRVLHPLKEEAKDKGTLSLLPGLAPPGPEQGLEKQPGHGGSPLEDGPSAAVEPCLDCPECVRMVTHLHRDCIFLDGTSGSIKIDDVRGIRPLLGEPPREAARRMIILREAQALVEAAANALLKSLEEPSAGTAFVLLAPQRERLLPTLVSRSVTLTLPWPDSRSEGMDENLIPWEAALCDFLRSGRGWLERTGTKGMVDVPLAHAILNMCRRALAARLTAEQSGAKPAEGLERHLARLPLQRLRMLDEVLAECQDSLTFNVNPVLVMEWFATRLYLLMPR